MQDFCLQTLENVDKKAHMGYNVSIYTKER